MAYIRGENGHQREPVLLVVDLHHRQARWRRRGRCWRRWSSRIRRRRRGRAARSCQPPPLFP
ncbi:unnamed protein product [Spirodela intermedia]|uniref:Uncharacterized protein n=1 Tax=Spirodela intermedia TaxID=51605 RepID=A0A7I8IT90_SPIIN|nr:unnamed protein product [Spirodela intermedia]CAA6661094.1 unnamed protein product [Spirodela intermedia]